MSTVHNNSKLIIKKKKKPPPPRCPYQMTTLHTTGGCGKWCRSSLTSLNTALSCCEPSPPHRGKDKVQIEVSHDIYCIASFTATIDDLFARLRVALHMCTVNSSNAVLQLDTLILHLGLLRWVVSILPTKYDMPCIYVHYISTDKKDNNNN